jgi:proline dehydrogenase
MKLLAFLAKRFVVGETMDKAIIGVKKMNEKKIKCTLDILGEDIHNKSDAESLANEYIKLLEEIKKNKLDSHVSLKLTMMGLAIDKDFCLKNVERIVKKAKELKNFVRVDMEGSNVTQVTLDIFYALYKKYPQNVGIVLQAYLFRAEKDVQDVIKKKARLRLCKGAYKEPKEIVYKKMEDIRANFLKLTKMLLDKGNYPAIATHDKVLIDQVLDYVKEKKIKKDKYEFQMLYGIQRALQEKLALDGYNMRVYVPYGTAWLKYTYRRLREKKENVFFVMKHFFLFWK